MQKKRNGKCLALRYIGGHQKYPWQCSENHKWKAIWDSVRRGTWCPKCKGKDGFVFSIELIKDEIEKFYAKNGKRPTAHSTGHDVLNFWRRSNVWLQNNEDTSLSYLCDSLGLDILNNRDRSVKDIENDIIVFYKKTGKRPVEKTSKEWENINGFLRRIPDEDLSLPKLCDRLGIPQDRDYSDIDIESIKNDIITYCNENGSPPNQRTSIYWRKLEARLFNRGTSIFKLSQELGVNKRNHNRTLGEVDAKIRSYFAETGKKPNQRTSREFRIINGWLNYNKKTTLSKRCKELGLE